ncbi:BnaCnng29730D [Brassica napus]|uniref:BnaCnng29730D protein n=1 Tax=Brassica napus TaxID=3708 RepID=A0A078J1X5_BRANA|nr:BnaCnng29730D [Brassica napus]
MSLCYCSLDSIMCLIYNGPSGIYPLVHHFAGPSPAGILYCCTIGFQASVASHLLCPLAGKKFQNLLRHLITNSGFCFLG